VKSINLISDQQLKRAIIQKLYVPNIFNVEVYMLRLDLIDDAISGNKWFKLKKNIEQARTENKNEIITFGGSFSNHIAATAKACNLAGLKCTGIIRGERVNNHTLQEASKLGMQIEFVSRGLYRNKLLLQEWLQQHYDLNNKFIIPEGGANSYGIEGCKQISALIDIPFDYLALACGTGTTLAGVVQQIKNTQKVIGFSALKGGTFLKADIDKVVPKEFTNKFIINSDFHCGGYAKHTPELLSFIKDFYNLNKIKLDFVYTAKLMYGLTALVNQQYFPPNSNIVAIHSGGLQGNEGIGI